MKRFSGLTFNANDEGQLFECQEFLRTETIDELYMYDQK